MRGSTGKRYDPSMNTSLSTPTLTYLPIATEVADMARQTMRDAFGHQLRIERNQGPCRSCLRISTAPEDLILLSYRPLADTNPYAEVGPIFVHAHACAPYTATDTFPPDFARRELIVRAYTHEGRIADAVVTPGPQVPQAAAAFLADASIAEVHVRHRSYTCYAFKIVRA